MASDRDDEDRDYLDHNAAMDRDEDVAHDLHNRTSGDPTTRAWSPPKPVTTWPCRTCGVPVAVTEQTIENLEICNRQLRGRGEPEIRTNEVMWCSRCGKRAQMIRTAQLDEEQRAVHAAIKVLREKPEPTDLERQAAALGPCTPDCRAVLDAEVLMRRVFGFEGDAMIRAHRTSKKGRKSKVSV